MLEEISIEKTVSFNWNDVAIVDRAALADHFVEMARLLAELERLRALALWEPITGAIVHRNGSPYEKYIVEQQKGQMLIVGDVRRKMKIRFDLGANYRLCRRRTAEENPIGD